MLPAADSMKQMLRLDPRAATLLLAAPLLTLSACSGGGAGTDASLPPIEARGGLTSLLAMEEARTVVTHRPHFPVQQNLIQARASGQGDYGLYPAVEVTPPCEISYDVPATHPQAELTYAVCAWRGNYRGEGRLVFELEFDGEPVAEHVLPTSESVAKEDRRWHRFNLPVGGGGKLVVRTRYEGDQEIATRAGLGLLTIGVPYTVERQPARDGSPNVVVVMIDTLRADRLSSYGYETATTPCMDALAARGLRYENAYATSPWTIPSTASVLTGMSPPEHGLGFTASYYLANSITTLAETFQASGFTTAGIATNPLISPSRNFSQGFEHFETLNWTPSYRIYDQVEGWVRANADKRFFLYIHYTDPHFPYAPTDESRAKVDAVEPDELMGPNVPAVLADWYADPTQPLEPLLATNAFHSKMYDAQVMDVDHSIGRLMAVLEELGIDDNTIVAVTSDHGEEFLEHGWSGHHAQLYDESVRIPLILAGPGIPAGEVREVRVENRWLGGTLLRLVGIDLPSGFRGPDLITEEGLQLAAHTPVFQTNTQGWWADLDARQAYKLGQQHALLYDDWRLIWRPNVKGGEELSSLYDLSRDPDSMVDLSDEDPERVRVMRGLIQRWIRESRERSPELVPAMAATTELLEGIGYIEGEE